MGLSMVFLLLGASFTLVASSGISISSSSPVPLVSGSIFKVQVSLDARPESEVLVDVRVVTRGFQSCGPPCLSPAFESLYLSPSRASGSIDFQVPSGDGPGRLFLIQARSGDLSGELAVGWIGAVRLEQDLSGIICDDEMYNKSQRAVEPLFVHREIVIHLPYAPPAGTSISLSPIVAMSNGAVAVVTPAAIVFNGSEPDVEKSFWVSCDDPRCAENSKVHGTLSLQKFGDEAGRFYAAPQPKTLVTRPLLSSPCPEEFYKPAPGQALKFFCPNTLRINMSWLANNTVARGFPKESVKINLNASVDNSVTLVGNNSWYPSDPGNMNLYADVKATCQGSDDKAITLTFSAEGDGSFSAQSWPESTVVFVGKCPQGRGIVPGLHSNMCNECNVAKSEGVLFNGTCGTCPIQAMQVDQKSVECKCFGNKIDVVARNDSNSAPRYCMQCQPGFYWVSIISPCRSCHGGLQIALLLGFFGLLVAYALTEIKHPPSASGSLKWTYFDIGVQIVQLAALSAVPVPEYEAGRVMALLNLDLTAIWLPCMVSQGPIVLIVRLLLPLLTLGCAVVLPRLPGFFKSVRSEVSVSLASLASPLSRQRGGPAGDASLATSSSLRAPLIAGQFAADVDPATSSELIKETVREKKRLEQAATRSVWMRLLWFFALPIVATSLEVFDCIPDTGMGRSSKLFLRSNPMVPCDHRNGDFVVMKIISIVALALVAGVLPLRYLAVTLTATDRARTRFRLWNLAWHLFRFTVAFAMYLSNFATPFRFHVKDKFPVDYRALEATYVPILIYLGVATPAFIAFTAIIKPWGPLVRGKMSPAYLAFTTLLAINVPSFVPRRIISWVAWAVGSIVLVVMGAHGLLIYIRETRHRMKLLREELMGEVDRGTHFLMPRRLLALLEPVGSSPGLLELAVPAHRNSDARNSEANPAFPFVSVIAEELERGSGDTWTPVLTRVVFRYNRTLARAFRERLRILGRREPLGRAWPNDGLQAEREAVRAVLQTKHLDRIRRIVEILSEGGEGAVDAATVADNTLFSSAGSLTSRARGPKEGSLHGMADVITAADIARAGLDLVWHGSSGGLPTIDSICRTGFVNLSILNKGFHGRGYYLTGSPAYATYYVLQGGHNYANMTTDREVPVLLAWTLVGTAYPVLEKMTDNNDFPVDPYHAGYPGHDSHYALVGDRGVTCSTYLPTPQYLYDEICCFQESQTLPIAVVYFQFGAK